MQETTVSEWPNTSCDFCRNEDDAIEVGHLQCLRAAYADGYKFDKVSVGLAAMHNQTELVRFFISKKVPVSEAAAIRAASHGNIDMLHMLFEAGAPCTNEVIANAAEFGHLSCVRYLLQKMQPDREFVYWSAVLSDYVDIVKLLHDAGVKWGPITMSYAKNSPSCRAFFLANLSK